jgi:phage tail sheath gpL-like
MDTRDRHDRIVRLLEVRLEALARASERSLAGSGSLESDVLRAAVATRHAIELDLLSLAEADAIWAEVARRHPGAAWCRRRFDLAA